MKRLLVGIVVLGSYCAADNRETQHDKQIAANIVKVLEKVAQSKESLEWQMDLIKHLQKGLSIIVSQSKHQLSDEEKAMVDEMLLVLGRIFEFAKMAIELKIRLASNPEDAEKIVSNMCRENFSGSVEAMQRLLEIFDNFRSAEVKQSFEKMRDAFMQHFCTAMSAALPAVAAELEN